MDGGFGDNVGIEAVAEVDGVDVVAGAKLACEQSRDIRAEPWRSAAYASPAVLLMRELTIPDRYT